MKNKVQKKHTKRSSRFVAFAAIVGLGLGAMFTSTASAIGDTDPVIELDGTCDLFGPESPSGIWMSITNNDGWDEEYAIGVFDGMYEDDGEPILDEPLEVIFTNVESGDTEWGPILADTLFATIQVMDIDDGGMDAELVFHDTISVCIIIPDFDFGGEDDEDDDGPGFDFDIPEFDFEPEIPDFEIDPGIDLPDFGFGDDDDEDESDDEEGDAPIVVEDEDEEGDAPVIVEGGVEDDDEGDKEEAPVLVEGNDDEGDKEEAPVLVEGNDDEGDKEEAPVVVEDAGCDCVDADDTSHPLWEELWGSDDSENPVIVWENTTNDSSLDNNEGNTPVIEEIGYPPEPEINPEDTDEGDGIGVPPEPKINPEDTDEAASSEGNETQGKSGLSILWIILIIVGGITTVGTTTRAIQKNNN